MQQIISQQKNTAFYDTAAQKYFKTCNYLNHNFFENCNNNNNLCRFSNIFIEYRKSFFT